MRLAERLPNFRQNPQAKSNSQLRKADLGKIGQFSSPVRSIA
jgi:hypothetical protein